jgi:hypothetical protein
VLCGKNSKSAIHLELRHSFEAPTLPNFELR